MANRNGMGPENLGSLTGRGMGGCGSKGSQPMFGQGMGLGRGAGRAFGGRMKRQAGNRGGFRRCFGGNYRFAPNRPVDQASSLEAYRQYLETELQAVETELGTTEQTD